MLAEFFEAGMLLFFGVAWPASILKSYQARTARGKSLYFLIIIIMGYICGIMAKLLAGNINFVLLFYFLNLIMVSIDVGLYFRNRKYDRLAEGLSDVSGH